MTKYTKIPLRCLILLIPCLLIGCVRTTERKTNYEVHGIDVSRYQGKIDWEQVQKDSIHFVFIKATEGGDYVDPNYESNRLSLRNLAIKKGAYHYFRPKSSAQLQVDNFYLYSKLEKGDLPPVVDFEVTEDLPLQIVRNNLSQLLTGLEDKYHVKPIIYTNVKLYYAFIAGRFDQYPIWIARYNDKAPKLSESRDWSFWQYGQRGIVKGIHGDVDLDVFNGNMEDLEKICLPDDPYSVRDALY